MPRLAQTHRPAQASVAVAIAALRPTLIGFPAVPVAILIG